MSSTFYLPVWPSFLSVCAANNARKACWTLQRGNGGAALVGLVFSLLSLGCPTGESVVFPFFFLPWNFSSLI